MDSFVNTITAISDFLWGAPLTVLLIGTGIFATLLFNGSFLYKWKTHFKNSFGNIVNPIAGEGTVSSFSAACTAMANTIGTGNIAGVSTAIVAGGPGAVFWMWITGFLGCSLKAAEIMIGQRYRVKFKNMDEYVCDRSFALRNAFGWKVFPFILAILTTLASPWVNLVQTEAVTSACREAFNANPAIVLLILVGSSALIVFGGLRRIAGIMDKVVPFMAIAYILGVVVIMVSNYTLIIPTIKQIFYCAFNPTAAVGGFAGATVRQAMRFGVARGLYSNDAGMGYGIIAHSPAITDHPVRQASWGWGEVFFDTIVICTMSALSILITGVYINRTDVSDSSMVTAAFNAAFGSIGSGFAAIAVSLFAWTTIIGLYYASENTVKYMIGDNKYTKIGCHLYMVYYLLIPTLFVGFDAAFLWSATDILSLLYVMVSCLTIIAKWKELRSLFDDFTKRYMPAFNRGENPERVSFETHYEKQSLL